MGKIARSGADGPEKEPQCEWALIGMNNLLLAPHGQFLERNTS